MDKLTIIRAEIESISPLYISDGEDILIDEVSNKAYLPATSIAGAFRSYLKSTGVDDTVLFGGIKGKESIQSKVYISDSYATVKGFERRDGVRIDRRTGSNARGAKIERFYLSKGLKFDLKFEIKSKDSFDLKEQIHKCLNAIEKTSIRFGGHKTSGLGVFKLKRVYEENFSLGKISDLKRYLKGDSSKIEDITEEIKSMNQDNGFVTFSLKGQFTTPMIIGAPESYDPDSVDGTSMKSGGNYVVPGSSFKGLLRSRIEMIADRFSSKQEAESLFGKLSERASSQKGRDNSLSRIWVGESEVDTTGFNEPQYNLIRVDKFTGGVRDTGLMNDIPIMGKTSFNLVYKKTGNEHKDNYAVGLISLALRDIGTENLAISGGSNKGRGRFKAEEMKIIDGSESLDLDFVKKTISNKEKIDQYVKAVASFSGEGERDE